jgi:signal transduction histidine kinase
VAAELAAALSEALSNIVTHDAATVVEVTIAPVGGKLTAQVDDDGHGITRLDRSNGLARMRARAEQLGGTVSWHHNHPDRLDHRLAGPDDPEGELSPG